MARKTIRPNRDFYVLRFADEQYEIKWKTGNLSRFMRNLWNSNEILREAWPNIKTAQEFALKKLRSICTSLYDYKKTQNTNSCPFYLVPRSHPHWKILQGTVKRLSPKSIKALQD